MRHLLLLLKGTQPMKCVECTLCPAQAGRAYRSTSAQGLQFHPTLLTQMFVELEKGLHVIIVVNRLLRLQWFIAHIRNTQCSITSLIHRHIDSSFLHSPRKPRVCREELCFKPSPIAFAPSTPIPVPAVALNERIHHKRQTNPVNEQIKAMYWTNTVPKFQDMHQCIT
jgi:hypothetical protein